MRMNARTNAKRHPDYLPGCDFRTSTFTVLLFLVFVEAITNALYGMSKVRKGM